MLSAKGFCFCKSYIMAREFDSIAENMYFVASESETFTGHTCHRFFLKLVSAIFYHILIFSPNDSPSKTLKNVFYFIQKALFVLEIFKFLLFFPFLSTLSRYKRTNGSGIIYNVMNWRA